MAVVAVDPHPAAPRSAYGYARVNTPDLFAEARTCEAEGRHADARDIYARLAGQGEVEAITALGKSLLVYPPVDHQRGIDLLLKATQSNNAEALRICAVMAAQGAGLPHDWGAAFNYLQASAAQGLEAAQSELRLLASASGDDWKQLRDGVDVNALLAPGRMQLVHTKPRIAIIENFLTPAFCDWLVSRAKPKIARAQTIDDEGAHYISSGRSNSSSNFNFVELDLALVLVRTRIAALAGLPTDSFENTQVLHYAPGQRFAAHYDFLDPNNPAQRQTIDQWGQRVVTFLVYLNDRFDGADTSFLKLNWRYRGNKGDAIMFRNVDASGAPDPATLHEGLAPTRGEKWLMSQWIRLPRSAARPG